MTQIPSLPLTSGVAEGGVPDLSESTSSSSAWGNSTVLGERMWNCWVGGAHEGRPAWSEAASVERGVWRPQGANALSSVLAPLTASATMCKWSTSLGLISLYKVAMLPNCIWRVERLHETRCIKHLHGA